MFFNAVLTSVIAFSVWKLTRRLFSPTRSVVNKRIQEIRNDVEISLKKQTSNKYDVNPETVAAKSPWKNQNHPDKFSKRGKIDNPFSNTSPCQCKICQYKAKNSKVEEFRRGDIPSPLQISRIKSQSQKDRPMKSHRNRRWKSRHFREIVSDLIAVKNDENVDHRVELQLVAKAADEANIASGSTEAFAIKKIFNSRLNLKAMNKELNRIKGKAFNIGGNPTIGHIRAVVKGIEDLKKNPEVKELINSNPGLNIFFKKLEGQVAKANARRVLATKQRPNQRPNLNYKCFKRPNPKQASLWHFGNR